MFEKLSKEKVFRDPLYGYVRVNYKIISQLIDTAEVQRLRRIRQLSGVSMVFHTAEHSRFSHSLGALQMANLVIENLDKENNVFTEYERILLLTAALLHDIGHGPYSHAFEHVFGIPHEMMSAKMILGDTEVNQVLKKHTSLASDIAGIISGNGKFPLIESLISSQLDVDRMDYLCRDAYFTGATYGNIDYNRILRCMRVVDGQLVFTINGVHSIESYIMSRYHMYWQVYFHPKARAHELILQSIYKRIKDLTTQKIKMDFECSSFINITKNKDDLKSYIDLDDAYINGMIKQLTNSNDDVLKKLSYDFQNRKLFSYLEITNVSELEKIKNENKDNTDYYFYEETISKVAYLESEKKKFDIGIKILTPNNIILSLEDYSPIIKGLISSGKKIQKRVYFVKKNEL